MNGLNESKTLPDIFYLSINNYRIYDRFASFILSLHFLYYDVQNSITTTYLGGVKLINIHYYERQRSRSSVKISQGSTFV